MLGLSLLRQGEEVAAVLSALTDGLPKYQFVVIEEPRRSTKTTSIFATLLGRCYARPGYRVSFTAQDQIKAGNILIEHGEMLITTGYAIDEDLAGDYKRHPEDFPNVVCKLRRSNGSQALIFHNGSKIQVLKPTAAAFRSTANDVVYIEEAGTYDEAMTAAVLSGGVPTMDTRPHAQMIITGTPGETETDLLSEALKLGYDKRERSWGVVDYSAPSNPSDPKFEPPYFVDEATGVKTLNEKLLRRTHPGLGTLTTMARLRANFKTFDKVGKVAEFVREYFCIRPPDQGATALDLAKWEGAARPFEEVPLERPNDAAFAFDVIPQGLGGAFAAAWRDEDGRAVIELIDSQFGTDWMRITATQIVRKYRREIAYDNSIVNVGVATQFDQAGLPIHPNAMRLTSAAAINFANEVRKANLVHFSQPDLTAAAESATWRKVGEGYLYGRKPGARSVAEVIAASVALWEYDRLAGRSPAQIRSSNRKANA